MAAVLSVTFEALRVIGILAQPFMPRAAAKLLDLLGIPSDARSLAHAAPEHRPSPDGSCRSRNPSFRVTLSLWPEGPVGRAKLRLDVGSPMTAPAFMFATGIENSNPTIDDGRTRVDEMEKCGHYEHWRDGLRSRRRNSASASCATGRRCTRTCLGPGRYDWAFADETFADLQRRDIVPIVDLCHFGVPDWIGNFQNPDFPELFAELRAGLRAPLPLGAALHPGQRDVHLRARSRPRTAGGTSS